jgi:hypothetical protein
VFSASNLAAAAFLDKPETGRTWAANVSRVVPGKGVQAWSTPTDGEPRPEGMGLLQFRAER